MGMDGLDERVFSTVRKVCAHDGDAWWLYLAECRACGQSWMVAQEGWIFDNHFLKRLDPIEVHKIVQEQLWPSDFLTYERVLSVGRRLSQPCGFFELLTPSLVYAVEELQKKRRTITVGEVAYLTGISPEGAAYLLSLPFPAPMPEDWDQWCDEVERLGLKAKLGDDGLRPRMKMPKRRRSFWDRVCGR